MWCFNLIVGFIIGLELAQHYINISEQTNKNNPLASIIFANTKYDLMKSNWFNESYGAGFISKLWGDSLHGD